jgi:copper chaperone CopZ
MTQLTLRIDGMHCGACVRRVTQTLQKVPGTEVQEVRVGAARVQVEDDTVGPALISSLEKAGYPSHLEQ